MAARKKRTRKAAPKKKGTRRKTARKKAAKKAVKKAPKRAGRRKTATPHHVPKTVLAEVASLPEGKVLTDLMQKLAAGRQPLPSAEKAKIEDEPHLVTRFTSHKRRAAWFRERAAWPEREAPVAQLVSERRRVRHSLSSAAIAATWQPIGPVNVGGRMTSVVAHPSDADRVLAGAAGGGVWRSTDAGRTWEPLWHDQDSLNVGALALDPKDPDVVYCGTGEANLSADSYGGAGLFRSTDGGTSWQRIASAPEGVVPIRIGAIAVDPFDSHHILLGGVGHYFDKQRQPGGLYVSHDGGQSWTRNTGISAFGYWCHAVLFHPSARGTVFISITERGVLNGIWRSRDGGATWQHLVADLPHSSVMSRTSLAHAPSEPDRLYAQVADEGSRILGVFRSDDAGESWAPIHGAHFRTERQMNYNNTIVVHPEDADHVLCGGVDVHRTRDGGASWRKVTNWRAERGRPTYAHADHHALLMPAGAPGRVYDLNDGGMDVSEDGGSTWQNRSMGLATTMYYDLAVSQVDARMFGGGAQDNGTPITVTGRNDDHFDITGGDGGWLVLDPTNADHVIASIYNMMIFRWRPATRWVDISPNEDPAVKDRLWMVYVAMDPHDSNVVFTGSHRVWRTRNDGRSWKAVSGPLDGSTITAIEVSRADGDRIYVATGNGGVFRSTDGGDTWSGDLSGGALPGRQITRIAARPDSADQVLVTVGNFGHPHVFRSSDGGLTWDDIDGGTLPDVPHSSIAIPTRFPDEVYVAGDGGVFVSRDFGDTWSFLAEGLPNVSVVDLVYHDEDDTLTAATYGRSLWRIRTR